MFNPVKIYKPNGELKSVITSQQLKKRDAQLFPEGSDNVKLNKGTGVRNEPIKFPCARPGCDNIGESWSTRGGKYCSTRCGNIHRKSLKKDKS